MKWVSYSSLPKETLHISIPIGLRKPFQDWLKDQGTKTGEFLTYYICEVLGKDPADYGLHPLRDRGTSDG